MAKLANLQIGAPGLGVLPGASQTDGKTNEIND
jgi:hypothetical protein